VRLRPRASEALAGRARAPAAGGALAALLLAACGGPARAIRPDPVLATPTQLPFFIPMPDETRARIVAAAAAALHHGSGPFQSRGRRFNPDCSGFVAAVYHAAGIPFREALHVGDEDAGSAVVALYRALASKGVIFGRGERPLPADLVFFDDTYDRNGDGLADDPLTHVGVVERADADGTVTFFHRGTRGVARGVMSLRHPGDERGAAGQRLNSRLRPARPDDPPGTRYLAGELFAAFGRFDAARIAAALDGSPDLSLAALGLDE
jgi:probable lipoprotein NlpC